MSVTVPISFLRYQAPNFAGMLGAGLCSVLPRIGRGEVETPGAPVHRRLDPVPESLIAAYAAWTGAPPGRYAGVLPPHMFSYWGLGLVARVAGRAPYNLLATVNQGCRIVTRRPMPADEPIEVAAHLADVSDDGRRIRIATHLHAGTASAPDAQSIDVVAAVPRRNPKGGRCNADAEPEPEFETVGRWSAGAGDGVNFALLTGDFNPLHTLPPVGRRTRYGGCILHGFGILSRTFETVRNAGIDIAVLDVRYVKPVPLPSRDLEVRLGREPAGDGSRALRLLGPDGALHMVGNLREELPA